MEASGHTYCYQTFSPLFHFFLDIVGVGQFLTTQNADIILNSYVCNQCKINYHLLLLYVVWDSFPWSYGVMEEKYVCFKNMKFCFHFLITAFV